MLGQFPQSSSRIFADVVVVLGWDVPLRDSVRGAFRATILWVPLPPSPREVADLVLVLDALKNATSVVSKLTLNANFYAKTFARSCGSWHRNGFVRGGDWARELQL
jgi:hypothetical protein